MMQCDQKEAETKVKFKKTLFINIWEDFHLKTDYKYNIKNILYL